MTRQMNIFDSDSDTSNLPLAERCRPQTIEDVKGQDKLLSSQSLLTKMIQNQKLSSFILWGPPGCGKTTTARLIAKLTDYDFLPFSAVLTGIKEVKQVMKQAEENFAFDGKSTVLFIDEIHRFNKAQQDAFLPYIEKGSIILIGATTENPSFEIIPALLSRCHIFVMSQLEDKDLRDIINRALSLFNPQKVVLEDSVVNFLIDQSGGDARRALNNLEVILHHLSADDEVTVDTVKKILANKPFLYDKNREEHFNHISALHKSLRASDAQAALYWLARMLESGEDPLYIVRRLVRFASEDIGLTDPNALVQSIAVKDAVHFLGMPEADNALAQLVVYLATAPKSNAVYTAYNSAADDAIKTGHLPVPLVIRNAPTKLMKELDYGKDYKYAHEYTHNYAYIRCFPEGMNEKTYYKPTDYGFEKEIKKRLEWWLKLKEKQQNK